MSKIVMRFCILLIVLIFSSVGHAGSLNISIDSKSVHTGEGKIAFLYFDTKGEALGAFQIEFTYNAANIDVVSVESGDSLYFEDLNSKIDGSKGIIKLNAFQGLSMDKPVGNILLAKIRYKQKNGLGGEIFQSMRLEFFTPQGEMIPVQ